MIVFDDMIVDIRNNKTFQAIVKVLFNRYRKLILFLPSITQSDFYVAKGIRLNSTHYLMLIGIDINHSGDIDYKYLMKIYRGYTN